jgi:aryl-alcohol dehydrogenase-like predicted oxidoreductase
VPIVANQVQYSMPARCVEDDVAPVCREGGIGLWAWSPLAQGVLTGKYLPGQPAPAGSRALDEGRGAELIQRWMSDEILHTVQELNVASSELGMPLAHLALAWLLGRPGVSGVVVGGSRPEQIIDNINAAGRILPTDVGERLNGILTAGGRQPHN